MSNIDHTHWPDSRFIYFRGYVASMHDEPGYRAIYRVHVLTGQLEKIADLDRFPFATFEWFGITPNGEP
jgi:hypothetical protein